MYYCFCSILAGVALLWYLLLVLSCSYNTWWFIPHITTIIGYILFKYHMNSNSTDSIPSFDHNPLITVSVEESFLQDFWVILFSHKFITLSSKQFFYVKQLPCGFVLHTLATLYLYTLSAFSQGKKAFMRCKESTIEFRRPVSRDIILGIVFSCRCLRYSPEKHGIFFGNCF